MTLVRNSSTIAFALLLGGVLAPGAQASAGEGVLPDEPGVTRQQQQQVLMASNAPLALASTTATHANVAPQQTKRILYILPNFRSVSTDEKLPAQTVKEKLKTASEDSFDYSSFLFVAGQAGIAQASRSYPEFQNGAKGFSRYYWHTLADSINENTFVEFLVPAALHQDTRFYVLGRGNFGKRLGYAFTRILVTRNDDGHETFNYSEVLGAGIFAGVANVYYPSQERTEVKSYQRWITNLCIDGATFAVKEIWPDIDSSTFHRQE